MNTAIIRGRILTFKRRPNSATDTESFNFIEDGALFVTNGIISKLGSFSDIIVETPKEVVIYNHQPHLLVPGFIDTHLHFPQIQITINGGITNCSEIKSHLDYVDGVMLGRAVYNNPFLLSEVDSDIFGEKKNSINREQVLKKYMVYMSEQLKIDVPIRSMTRHILGLYHGEVNAKLFRRSLSGKVVGLDHLNEWLDFKKNSLTDNESTQ